ncbi:MAG: hypothetical protein NZ853_00460 [Leptospiraceae bacterium]|nr:hypothetical protein [Leptospiraceae bacterium]MDW7976300.1 hypothetical protein [Leptospiraceae bacterium]
MRWEPPTFSFHLTKFFLFSLSFLPLRGEDFSFLKHEIYGEISNLRKIIEAPAIEKRIYDSKFREFFLDLQSSSLEFSWNEFKKNYADSTTQWQLLIPVDGECDFYLAESQNLWKRKRIQEALFLWKSLEHCSDRKIQIEASKLISNMIKNETYKQLYLKMDPIFFFEDTSSKTKIISNLFGFTLKIPNYWYIYQDPRFKWFYLIEKTPSNMSFVLYNTELLLYFHFFLVKQKDRMKIKPQEVLDFIDVKFSWNQNTKEHYNYLRKSLEKEIYFVSYEKSNQTKSYYEMLLFDANVIIYIRIYPLKDFSQKEVVEFLKNIHFS